MKSVAVITSSTGRSTLRQTVDSVAQQTYPCQHYVIFDGVPSEPLPNNVAVLELPRKTGINGMMNGAICAMSAFVASEDYMCWIDDDNWIDPNHIESLIDAVDGCEYAYSLRKLMNPDGSFWQQDNAESIGHFGEMVDVNCFLIKRSLAVQLAPLWYNTTGTLMVGDRVVFNALKKYKLAYKCTGLYTVNYRLSVARNLKPFLFLNNIVNQSRYPDGFPWALYSGKIPVESSI